MYTYFKIKYEKINNFLKIFITIGFVWAGQGFLYNYKKIHYLVGFNFFCLAFAFFLLPDCKPILAISSGLIFGALLFLWDPVLSVFPVCQKAFLHCNGWYLK